MDEKLGLFRFHRATNELQPLYRGVQALTANSVPSGSSGVRTSKSSKPASALPPLSVHIVSATPGHLAASFQGGRVFCVFDAVTPDKELSDSDQQRLNAFVRGAEDVRFSSLLALRTVDSTIINIHFFQVPYSVAPTILTDPTRRSTAGGVLTRLLVIQRNATFLVWDWNPHSAKWLYVSRGVLPSPLLSAPVSAATAAASGKAGAAAAGPARVVSSALCGANGLFVWTEENGTAGQPLAWACHTPNLALASPPDFLESGPVITLPFEPTGPVSLHATQRGAFIAGGGGRLSLLHFWSQQRQTLVRVRVPAAAAATASAAKSGSAAAADDDACLFCVHPTTNQLLAVDRSGRLIVFFEPDSGDVPVRAAVQCSLAFPAAFLASAAGRSGSWCARDSATLLAFRHYVALLVGPAERTLDGVSSSGSGGSGGSGAAGAAEQKRAGGSDGKQLRASAAAPVRKQSAQDSDDEEDEAERERERARAAQRRAKEGKDAQSQAAGVECNAFLFSVLGGVCVEASAFDPMSFPLKGTWSSPHGFGGTGSGFWSEQNVWFIKSAPVAAHVTALSAAPTEKPAAAAAGAASGPVTMNGSGAAASASGQMGLGGGPASAAAAAAGGSSALGSAGSADTPRVEPVPGVGPAYLADLGARLSEDFGPSMEHAQHKAALDRLIAKVSARSREEQVPAAVLRPSDWTTDPPGALSSTAAALGAELRSTLAAVSGSSAGSLSPLATLAPSAFDALSLGAAGSAVPPPQLWRLEQLAAGNSAWQSPVLNSLQNPALVVALLSQPQHDEAMREELERFLRSVQPLHQPQQQPLPSPAAGASEGGGALSAEGERAADAAKRQQLREAFEGFTSLNLSLQPLLRRYLGLLQDLQRIRQGSIASPEQLSALFSLGHLPTLDEELSHAVNSRLQQAGRPDYNFKSQRSMDSLIRQDPLATLNYLQGVMGVEAGGPSSALSAASSAASTAGLPGAPGGVGAAPTAAVSAPGSGSGSGAAASSLSLGGGAAGSAAAAGTFAALAADGKHLLRLSRSSHTLVMNEEIMLRKDPSGAKVMDQPRSKQISRYDSLPYFEILCRLYDEQCPELLVPFVRLVAELCPWTDDGSIKRADLDPFVQKPVLTLEGSGGGAALGTAYWSSSYYERALRVLQPIHPRPPVVLPKERKGERKGDYQRRLDQQRDERIRAQQARNYRVSARSDLLIACRRLCEAVLLRLSVASQDGDPAQEEAAIQLAYAHVGTPLPPLPSKSSASAAGAAAVAAATSFNAPGLGLATSAGASVSSAAATASAAAAGASKPAASASSAPAASAPASGGGAAPSSMNLTQTKAYRESHQAVRAELFHHFLMHWLNGRAAIRRTVARRAARSSKLGLLPTSTATAASAAGEQKRGLERKTALAAPSATSAIDDADLLDDDPSDPASASASAATEPAADLDLDPRVLSLMPACFSPHNFLAAVRHAMQIGLRRPSPAELDREGAAAAAAAPKERKMPKAESVKPLGLGLRPLGAAPGIRARAASQVLETPSTPPTRLLTRIEMPHVHSSLGAGTGAGEGGEPMQVLLPSPLILPASTGLAPAAAAGAGAASDSAAAASSDEPVARFAAYAVSHLPAAPLLIRSASDPAPAEPQVPLAVLAPAGGAAAVPGSVGVGGAAAAGGHDVPVGQLRGQLMRFAEQLRRQISTSQ